MLVIMVKLRKKYVRLQKIVARACTSPRVKAGRLASVGTLSGGLLVQGLTTLQQEQYRKLIHVQYSDRGGN